MIVMLVIGTLYRLDECSAPLISFFLINIEKDLLLWYCFSINIKKQSQVHNLKNLHFTSKKPRSTVDLHRSKLNIYRFVLDLHGSLSDQNRSWLELRGSRSNLCGSLMDPCRYCFKFTSVLQWIYVNLRRSKLFFGRCALFFVRSWSI